MKFEGNGQAKILSKIELQTLFQSGFTTPRDKALFAICFFCACRIGEALQLPKNAVTTHKIIFIKNTTKGKQKTREIAVNPDLAIILKDYDPPKPENPFYFPGYSDHLRLSQASKIFQKACRRVNILGASTHSFRRTALTQMHKQGVPLRVIQDISGHESLAALQRYLEVSEEQKETALKLVGWQ